MIMSENKGIEAIISILANNDPENLLKIYFDIIVSLPVLELEEKIKETKTKNEKDFYAKILKIKLELPQDD
jgi:hypothetical protein